MSINTTNGILDITGAVVRVSKMEFKQATGFDTVFNNIARNTILLSDSATYLTASAYHNWALKLPNAWVLEADVYLASGTAGGGDHTFQLNFYNNVNTDVAQGYVLGLDGTSLTLKYDGTQISTATLSSTLNDNAWHKLFVLFERDTFAVAIDGKAEYTFTDSTLRDRVYNDDAGYVVFYHEAGVDRQIKNIKFVNGDKWIRESGSSNIAYIGGSVGIGTHAPKHTLDVLGNANVGTLTVTSVSGDGSGLSLIQSSNVSDFASNVTRIQTLETDLDSNVTRIQTLETDLDSNVSRIQTLETDLDSNVTRIQNLESANMTIDGEKTFSSNLEVGTANLFVDTTTGRVGVGTVSPQLELHIHDANSTNSGMVLSSSTDYARFYASNGQLYIQSGTEAASDSRSNIHFTSMYASEYFMTILGSNGNVGIGTNSPRTILDVNDTGAITIPTGTTAQQPSATHAGMVRFNTDKSTIEYYNGSNWATVGGVSASGGTETNASGYKIHTFSSVGNTTFNVYTGGSIEILLVAGGGGGGGRSGGGGGGGGVVHKTSHDVTPGSYTITVGAGGAGGITTGSYGSNGSDTTAFGLTAKGGGGGASDNANGANPGQGNDGGCGGGGRYGGNGGSGTQTTQTGDSGTYGRGYDGGGSTGSGYYNGGGGGGAGGVGGNGTTTSNGNGGIGYQTNISGTNTYYAGGGGGGSHDPWPGAIGTGGAGGGGDGGDNSNSKNGKHGTDGLGGGGGAGSTTSGTGGAGGTGGDGVVIIRYLS